MIPNVGAIGSMTNRMRVPVPFFLLFFCILAIPQNSIAQIDGPIRLDSGLIEGVAGNSSRIRVFKGIPYATPPTGNLRWKAPQPLVPWDGVRKANHFGPICPQPPYLPGSFYQLEFFSGPQPPSSEDCLYLNIWTAAKSADERRPVMVWIHGGGNIQGYGSETCFYGAAFANHGVVLVTFNYRLGIFGLFAHPELAAESEHHVSGNYQELDQIAALQWVQKNIAAFGGDPANVTVFGQSSGGASINRLLVTPLAHGLFQKVIIQSAAIFNSRDSKTKLADMEQRGVAMADSLGAKTIDELRQKSPDDLLAAAKKFKFDPNIDGYVLPELAVDVYVREGQTAVPMMIGSTSDEGPLNPVKMETFTQDVRKQFGSEADQFLNLYPFTTDDEAAQAKHDSRRDESFAGERAEARMQAALAVPTYLY
jgi:para-nitrobenzyl esterase